MSRLFAIPPQSMGIPTMRRDKLAQRNSYTSKGDSFYPNLPTWVGSSTFTDDRLLMNPTQGLLAKTSNIVSGEFWVITEGGMLEAWRIDNPRAGTVTKIAQYNWRANRPVDEPNSLLMLNGEYGVGLRMYPNDSNQADQYWVQIRRVGSAFELSASTPVGASLPDIWPRSNSWSYGDFHSSSKRFASDRGAFMARASRNGTNQQLVGFYFFRYKPGVGVQCVHAFIHDASFSTGSDYGYGSGFIPLENGRTLVLSSQNTAEYVWLFEDTLDTYQRYALSVTAPGWIGTDGGPRQNWFVACPLFLNYFIGLGTDGVFHIWEQQGTNILDRGTVSHPAGGIGSPFALARINEREFVYLSIAAVPSQPGWYSYRRQLGTLNADWTVTWQTAQDGTPDMVKFKGDSAATFPRSQDIAFLDINNIVAKSLTTVNGQWQVHLWNLTRKPAS